MAAGPFVLLHGFTQTGRAWDGVREHLPPGEVLTPDLLGHGGARDVGRIAFAAQLDELDRVVPDGRMVVVGYSLGGRIALRWAVRSPERITRLVLIGVNPGLMDPAERSARRRSDDVAATGLEREGLEPWARRWGDQPLFADQPPEIRRLADADRSRNTARGLAAALRGMGAGVMAPVWDQLETLTMPVICAAGERDHKYRTMAEAMAERLPHGEAVVIPGAGHAAHLENPEAVARLIAP